MPTLTLTAENPEILLKVQDWLAQFPEIRQKESADIKKAKANAQVLAEIQEGVAWVKSVQRGETKPMTNEEFWTAFHSDDE